MLLDYQKELFPHFFNSNGIKIRDFQSDTPGHQIFVMHWHSNMEFLYMTSGTLKWQLGNDHIELHAGDFAVTPPLTPHGGVVGDDGVKYTAIIIDPTHFVTNMPIMQKRLIPIIENKVKFLTHTTHPNVISVVKELLKPEYNNADSMMQLAKMYELIEMIYQHCLGPYTFSEKSSTKLKVIREYIDEHFYEDISTASLSKKFGYSEEHFCRLFKSETGLSPMSYIRTLRLEKASELLRKDKRPLSIIAEECGFNSVQYFAQSFKSQYDLTPSEYIKKYIRRGKNT